MAIKIFTDTNIILDLFDHQRPRSKSSQALWQFIESGDTVACISESVLTTIDYILRRSLSRSKRMAAYTDLLDYVDVLPCTDAICRKAIQFHFPDLEDAILYQLTLEHEVDYFITNDNAALKKMALPQVPVITADEFLKRVK